MKCNYDDCFTCPYPDCVIGLHEVLYDPQKLEERRLKRKEYERQYYLKRKAKKVAKHDRD